MPFSHYPSGFGNTSSCKSEVLDSLDLVAGTQPFSIYKFGYSRHLAFTCPWQLAYFTGCIVFGFSHTVVGIWISLLKAGFHFMYILYCLLKDVQAASTIWLAVTNSGMIYTDIYEQICLNQLFKPFGHLPRYRIARSCRPIFNFSGTGRCFEVKIWSPEEPFLLTWELEPWAGHAREILSVCCRNRTTLTCCL